MTRPPFPTRAECAAILRGAADLLEGRPKCVGTLARTATGEPCDPSAPEAASFCVLGALLRVAPSFSAAQDAARVVERKAGLGKPIERAALASWSGMASWFDHETVSVREAVRVLRAVAKGIEGS